jgi:hypothetical protein
MHAIFIDIFHELIANKRHSSYVADAKLGRENQLLELATTIDVIIMDYTDNGQFAQFFIEHVMHAAPAILLFRTLIQKLDMLLAF